MDNPSPSMFRRKKRMDPAISGIAGQMGTGTHMYDSGVDGHHRGGRLAICDGHFCLPLLESAN